MAPGGNLPRIAIGLAVVAVVMAFIGVVVVLGREPASTMAVAPLDAGPAPSPGPVIVKVEATDVVRLERDALQAGRGGRSQEGLEVADDELRKLLGLVDGDRITAISGRKVERQFDVYDAIRGAGSMNAAALYVEVLRDEAPVLMKWEVLGDLRGARVRRPSGSSGTPLGSLSLGTGTRGGVVGGVRGGSTLAPDPLLDTIVRIDDLHYKVPRSTIERLEEDPSLLSRSMRVFARQPSGLRVYPRAGSFGSAFGLRIGDSILSVNGKVLTRPDSVLQVYQLLKDETELHLDLDRRGQPVMLKITITR